MTSIIINSKQNIEDQYFEKFGLPMILCNYHQNSVCEFINLNSQIHNKLVCAQCIIKDRLNSEFLISVKELLSNNPNNIIQNWPPLQDLSIYKYLMTNEIQKSKKIESIQQINRYFDKLKVDILKIIDEHHKKILVHINSIEENRQRVIDIYNQVSIKDEIKNEFLKNKDNQKQLEQYLKQIISKQQNQFEFNQSTINIALNAFTKYDQQYKLDKIQELLKKYLNDLKSIDILNPILKTEQSLSCQILKKNKDYDEENNLNLKGQMFEKNQGYEQKYENNEIDLFQSLKLIKSNYSKPDGISLKKIENNNFLIEKKISLDLSQMIIDEELLGEKKYQIQIDVKKNHINLIVVGLLPISQKDQKGSESKLSLYIGGGGYGIDKIESGKHISKLKNIKQLSFQICLKEKILRCLCISKNVLNINSLDDWSKINPNEKYYFYIAFGIGEYKLEISQFKIIKQFDQW